MSVKIVNMTYKHGFSDAHSKLYHETKKMVQDEVLRVLQKDVSHVMGVKLVSFRNTTGHVVASLIIVMNKTGVELFNVTKQELYDAMRNGTFRSFDIDKYFDFDIKCKL